MALVVYDRVQETTATTGTGTITLSGAVAGYQSFAVVGNGNTTFYCIVNGSAWEVGIGTYSTSGPTLARTTVLSNSSGTTSPITLSGASNVFVTYPASKSINYDANGVATIGSVLGYSDTGIVGSFASTVAGYNQVIVQNKSSANTASSNFNVSNDAATSTTGYAELGINSSTYVGTGSFNIAGASYLASASTDLAIGTYGAYNVHFVTNSSTTDAMTIYNSGGVSLGGQPDPGLGTLYANNVYLGFTTVTAAAGTTVLTNSSSGWQQVVGTTTQTIQLPNATTLYKGLAYTIANNSTGSVTIKDNASTTIDTVVTGGTSVLVLTANGTSAGTWVAYSYIPASYDFNNSTASFGNASITNAVWNGTTIASGYGGTGLTTFTAANNAIYSTSASALAAGTLPIAAGGTAATTFTANGVLYGNGTSALGVTAAGTTGQVLIGNTGAAPSWATLSSSAVSSFSAGTTGFTPSSATTGAVTLAGTLNVANGGTGVTTSTGSGSNVLNTSPTLTTPAITGGTINNAVIGGTTPAAGTFTTITGQTEVLNGTGQNLFLQSQTFNTSWSSTALTINTTATTAPDSTTTGNSLIPTAVSSIHRIAQNLSVISGITYTVSIYAKPTGYNYLYMNGGGAINAATTFNLSTGAISNTASGTATITSVGSGWYRCTITGTTTVTQTNSLFFQVNNTVTTAADDTFTGDGTSGIFLWGAQFEIGSIANTYKVTTTTAVYGTPTLSFSGVSTIGLQSDGSLYVSPAGTGALQAQATTSSATGGNARGTNAVDWQTSRGNANQVASGQYSVISGGNNNRNAGFGGCLAGGEYNVVTGTDAIVAGGNSNQATGSRSAVVGGGQNLATGYYNFIGGGAVNSGTANAAVTTQSSTMNGTTAVTLGASNASIKVGQFISGTYISDNTYVAAVSGTSLTLSQAASGSGTATLSFYTPHGVVVGGGNNQATGSYSFIGGGGDAGTAANRNVASGDWSFVGGGIKNTASGLSSVVAGGGYYGANSAGGPGAFIAAGWANNASGAGTACLGIGGLANADYSSVLGGSYGTARSIQGNTVFVASNTPLGTAYTGQASLLILSRQTTDATATVLCSNASAAGSTNQVILPDNSAYYFKVSVIAGVTGAGNTKAWTLEGAIKRGVGVGTTAIVGTVTTTIVAQDAGASAWAVTATADTTNGGLAITVTGQASTTIRWVAKAETAEMTF